MTGSASPSVRDVARLFAGGRLALARQLAGLRKVELATRIGKTPTAVAGYESGRTRPAAATVAKLCIALSVEPSFFLPSSGRMLAANIVPHFRSLRSTTQLARDQAEAYGRVVHDLVTVFENHFDLPSRDLTAHPVTMEHGSGSTEPAEAAQELRSHWGVEKGPVGHLLRTAELHGLIVVFSPVQTASVDAYSFETCSNPIIILNPIKGDYYRQRFDLAHEIGHLVMHADAEPGNRVIEDQAHRFASEFLMPAGEIEQQLPRRINWPLLQELKEYWGVSLQALLYRARELQTISDVTYRNAMVRISKEGWRRQEPGARPAVEQPSVLPHALSLLKSAGIDKSVLATEARVPANLFNTVASRVPQTIDQLQPETAHEVGVSGDGGQQVISLFESKSE